MSKRLPVTFLLSALLIPIPVLAQQTQQQTKRQQATPTAEQIMQRVPGGVTFVPDIAYREEFEACRLDLAMPEERGDKARPALVFIHGGGWRNGDQSGHGTFQRNVEYLEPAREAFFNRVLKLQD